MSQNSISNIYKFSVLNYALPIRFYNLYSHLLQNFKCILHSWEAQYIYLSASQLSVYIYIFVTSREINLCLLGYLNENVIYWTKNTKKVTKKSGNPKYAGFWFICLHQYIHVCSHHTIFHNPCLNSLTLFNICTGYVIV